jgi:hypothetical protein
MLKKTAILFGHPIEKAAARYRAGVEEGTKTKPERYEMTFSGPGGSQFSKSFLSPNKDGALEHFSHVERFSFASCYGFLYLITASGGRVRIN